MLWKIPLGTGLGRSWQVFAIQHRFHTMFCKDEIPSCEIPRAQGPQPNDCITRLENEPRPLGGKAGMLLGRSDSSGWGFSLVFLE